MTSFRWLRGAPVRLFWVPLLVGALACGERAPDAEGEVRTEQPPPPPGDPSIGATPSPGDVPPPGAVPLVDEPVRSAADRALALLAAPDLPGLASLVHPERGVLFSPYASVDPESVVLSPEELRVLANTDAVRLWGYRDGSGEPIESTFQEYHRHFIYDGEFRTAPQVSVDERIGVGTTMDNIGTVFPEGVTVEYHLPGTDPQYEGLDWRSLRLVFVQEDARWWLVAVVHDQWTT